MDSLFPVTPTPFGGIAPISIGVRRKYLKGKENPMVVVIVLNRVMMCRYTIYIDSMRARWAWGFAVQFSPRTRTRIDLSPFFYIAVVVYICKSGGIYPACIVIDI